MTIRVAGPPGLEQADTTSKIYQVMVANMVTHNPQFKPKLKLPYCCLIIVGSAGPPETQIWHDRTTISLGDLHICTRLGILTHAVDLFRQVEIPNRQMWRQTLHNQFHLLKPLLPHRVFCHLH